MTYVLTILGLSLLITLHEAGHYLMARLCDMRVLRFSVGFGPALFKRKIGETEWQFAAVPLGGYVQIAGMGPTADGDNDDDGRGFRNKPVWQRIAVIFAGPAVNWLLAAVFITLLAATIGFNRYDDNSTVLGEVSAEHPAGIAGLLADDRVVTIDGEPVPSWPTMVKMIQASPEKPLAFGIERAGEKLTITVTPLREGEIGRIGVGPKPETVRLAPLAAVGAGFTMTWSMTTRYAGLLWGIIVGREEGQLSGPIRIVQLVSAQAAKGMRRLFETLAWLSVGLFLLNLAPVPALDGGRLVFLTIETVRGRPIDERLEGMVHAIGFLLLIALLIFVSVRDVVS